MATIDCPDVLPIGDEGDNTDENANDLEDVGNEEAEPTPRQRSLGKIKTVFNADLYQRIPAERAKIPITPYVYMSSPVVIFVEGALPPGGWRRYQTTLSDRFRYECKTHWGVEDAPTEEEPEIGQGTFQYINSGICKRENRNEEIEGIPFKVSAFSNVLQDEREEIQDVTFLKDFYKWQNITITALPSFFSRLLPNSGGVPSWFWPLWRIWVAGDTNLHAVRGLQEFVSRENGSIPPLFDTTREFFDHTFRITAPLSPKEMQSLNGLPRPDFAKVDMEYNFYVKEYETALARIKASAQALEKYLPNMYVFLSEKKSSNLDPSDQWAGSILHKHITLGGLIDNVSVDILNERGEKIGEKDKGQYFDKWGRAYTHLGLQRLTQGSQAQELDRRYKRIIFSPLDMENFKSFNEKRFLFPMYVDIEFSTDRTTLLAEAIKEAQLGSSLMKAVAAPLAQRENDPAYLPRKADYRIATELISFNDTIEKTITISDPEQRVVLDLLSWWSSFKNREIDTQVDSVILGSSLPEIFVSEEAQYRFVQTILTLIFSGKIKAILKGRLRSFEDIMNGKHAYSETVFYKISKHLINTSTGEPWPSIQDFYIPNSNELDIMRFIDTQVVFDREYHYIIHAYELVFGTAYKYLPHQALAPEIVPEDARTAIINVHMRPSIKLVEVPIFSFRTKISDKPPLPPQVDIIPYRGVSDRILVNLTSNVGELKAQPIALRPSEQLKIAEIRERHDLGPDDPIEYKGDDPADFFEVFRTRRKPEGYADFIISGTVREIDTEVLPSDQQTSGMTALPSAAYIDYLRPNVAYYYMFRAVDIRGNVSNPTSIFRVELVEESGMTFPIIEEVNFEPTEYNEGTKTFKKYIQISPSVIQDELNIINELEIESANDAEVELGIVEDRIFAQYPDKKKIKLRITSKHTGKKIDVNLNFTHKHTS